MRIGMALGEPGSRVCAGFSSLMNPGETTRSDVQSLASRRDITTAEMTSRRFVLRRGWPWNRRKAQTICNLRDVLVHGIECFPLAIDFSEVHPLQRSAGLVALDNWQARRRTPRSVPV